MKLQQAASSLASILDCPKLLWTALYCPSPRKSIDATSSGACQNGHQHAIYVVKCYGIAQAPALGFSKFSPEYTVLLPTEVEQWMSEQMLEGEAHCNLSRAEC